MGSKSLGRRVAVRAGRVGMAALWFALMVQCALAVTTTTVADTVYLANGSVATGTILIRWPTFTTAAGEAVPAGMTTVAVGANGGFSVALAPNAGAVPAGVYYTVAMHLAGSPVETEYWVVPATGTTTLAAIRSKVMPVTRAVPVSGGITSVAGLVEKSGDAMLGPLVLSGDPTAATQAATKNYVDTSAAVQQTAIAAATATATSANALAASANAAATAAQTTANGALPKAGGAMTGKLTLSGGLLAGRSDVFDMLSDCPALGYTIPVDGVTDAYPAIQSCIWTKLGTTYTSDRRAPAVSTINYPTFFLPRICQSQFGTCRDYVLSHQLDLPWRTKLVGGGATGEASSNTNLFFSGASQLSSLSTAGGGTLTPITVVTTVCNGTTSCTITTSAAHGLGAGQDEAHLSRYTTDAGLNKNFLVTTVPSSSTFTIAYAGPSGTYGSGEGTIAATRGGILARGYDHIENFQISGSYCFSGNNLASYVLPAGFGGTAVDDGVQFGGHTVLKNAIVSCFGRHGLNLDSGIFPGLPAGNLQADEDEIDNVFVSQNRGDGAHVGSPGAGDAGVNTLTQLQARSNQLYGAYATALYSSDFVTYLGDNNHADNTAHTSLGTPAGTVCATGFCTITMSAAHGLVAGDEIIPTGYADGGLNAAFFLSSVTSTTMTFPYAATESFGAAGTVTYATGVHVWALAGNTVQGRGGAGGCVYGPQGTWHTPYCEGNQPWGSFLAGGSDNQTSVVINPQGYAGPLAATVDTDAYMIRTHGFEDVGSTVKGTPNMVTQLDILPTDGQGYAWNQWQAGSAKLLLRRTAGASVAGWNCFQINGAYGSSLTTASGCFGDNLTVTGRSRYDAGTNPAFWAPNVLFVGNSEGTGQPDTAITTGAGAPGSGSWSRGDIVINTSPTAGGAFGWECVAGGTPGTWVALSFTGFTPVGSAPANVGGLPTVNPGLLASTTALNGGMIFYAGAGNAAGLDFGWDSTNFKYMMRRFSSSAYEIGDCFYSAGAFATGQWGMQNCPLVETSSAVILSKPLTSSSTVTIGSGGTAMAQSTVYAPNITPVAVAAQSCADQTFTVTGLVVADTLSRLSPPAALGNVGVGDAYASAANTLTLHFCNPSVGAVTPPAGVYAFRATH